ncbi:MAG: sulfatase-like hydrolase/transferase [Polyangia bacterium]
MLTLTRLIAKSAPYWAACLLLACGCGRRVQQGAQAATARSENRSPAASPAHVPVDLSGYRVSYDLLGNRVHAVEHRAGRLVIAAGGPGFLKFIDGGWKGSWLPLQKDGTTPVAYVSGTSAAFSFPVDADSDGVLAPGRSELQLTLTLRSLVPKQRLSVFVNEKPVATLDVEQTLRSYDVAVPAATLAAGDNRIRLTFRSVGAIAGGKRAAAAIAAVEVGAPRPANPKAAVDQPAAPSELAASEVEMGGVRRRALVEPEASRLSFYLQVPAQAKLALAYGSRAASASVAVRVARDGAAMTTLFEGPSSGRWTEGVWDLAPFAGQAVRLDFCAHGAGVDWAEPRLLVRAAAPTAASPHKFDHIYVWMIDTFRADKMHAYNPKTNVLTPNYDAFAADATRFAWAQVAGTWSLPSQASMLTGVYPRVHKATVQESKISREVPFVAEQFKKAGFRTAMFSANGYVSSKWGFDRGWDENRNLIRENLPNNAETLWGMAKKWIVPGKAKPQFVYLAVIEPHVIYNPRKEFLAKYWDKPYNGPIKPVLTGIQLGKIKQGTLKVNATDKAYIEALHNAEITQSDSAFAAFIQDLKTAGLYDKSVVIVISDHGDEFWDHGDCGHAQGAHQELVHVPFIIRAPGLLPAGRVIDTDVEAMDLSPTLLELAGLPVPDSMQGRSLIPLTFDEVGGGPAAGLTQIESVSRGLKTGRYRLIHSGVARMELFDELDDPREQHDLSGERPIALRQMRNVFGLLVFFENRWKKQAWGSAANVGEGFYRAIEGK